MQQRGGALHILIEEATGLGSAKERENKADPLDDLIDEMLSQARPILPGPGDRLVEFKWEAPIAYGALDESYGFYEAPVPGGVDTALHVLMDGAFRRYVGENSFVEAIIREQLVEYLLITEDMVFKVLSAQPPLAVAVETNT